MEQLLGSLCQKFSDSLKQFEVVAGLPVPEQNALMRKNLADYLNNIMAFARYSCNLIVNQLS